ncbi:MAG: DUF6361 family protein [Verrucomicrobiota bacterium]
MRSTFTWLDYSEHERRKMLEVIHSFDEKGTRDELGIGMIRDGLADLLFPGTGTVQTRARYFLFIPWIYLELERKETPARELADQARKREIELIYALEKGGEKNTGVIGVEAREKLQRLPSNIYWQGLGVWGIRRFLGSQDQYHRWIDSWYRQQAEHTKVDRGESGEGGGVQTNWHLSIPTPPAGWRILSRYREGERTLAEWSQVFADYPPEDFPLFKIEGSVATVVCRPGTGHPLQVFRCYNGTYSARAPAEDEVEGLDNMTVEELRLYRLDWPAHCQTVAQHLGLRGQIRGMPELPWFWRLGDLHTNSHHYAYFMAVIREDPDADIIAAALKSNPVARLIVPNLSDKTFHRLTEAKINFYVLAEGTPPHFPKVASANVESVTREAPTLEAGMTKLDAIADTTAKTLEHVEAMRPHVEGVPPLVEKAAEALANPMAAADDARRRMPLTREEHEIRDAIIAHGGTGKGAAAALGVSEATLSRKRHIIRKKMIAAGFPGDIVFRPSAGHKMHVKKSDETDGKPIVDYQPPSDDWREDPDTRRRIIRDYKSASREDKEAMRQQYPDIEAEAGEG